MQVLDQYFTYLHISHIVNRRPTSVLTPSPSCGAAIALNPPERRRSVSRKCSVPVACHALVAAHLMRLKPRTQYARTV